MNDVDGDLVCRVDVSVVSSSDILSLASQSAVGSAEAAYLQQSINISSINPSVS